MRALIGRTPGLVGWALILFGVVVLLAGTYSWIAQYLGGVNADATPDWLALLGRILFALLCLGLGLTAQVLAGIRRVRLRVATLRVPRR